MMTLIKELLFVAGAMSVFAILFAAFLIIMAKLSDWFEGG